MYPSVLATAAILAASITSTMASALPVLENRAGKPTGGPASAKVTIYSSYTCASPSTAPPTDGSAGTATSFTISEGTCTIPSAQLLFGGAITATLTATPKTGAAGCYVLGHTQQGCGITLTNYLNGWPFNGISVGNSVGCGNPPSGTQYGAFEVLCV